MIDIFSVANQLPDGEFFKFTAVGDKVQGTYIGDFETKDGFGNDQRVVVLKDGDKIWNVGIRMGTISHDESKAIALGEIVGFRFDREVPSKMKPGTMAKVINVYHDPAVVDQAWLESEEERRREIDESLGEIPDSAPVVEELAAEVKAEDPAIVAIRTLAVTKGLTDERDSLEEQDKAIQEFAEMTYSEENNTQIIVKLSALSL